MLRHKLLSAIITLTPTNGIKAQTKVQEKFTNFVTTEFSKIDISPKDYYISEQEFNKYVKGNTNVKMSNFDINNDKRLNIDEFTDFLTGKKNTTNQNAQDHSTKFQTSKNIDEFTDFLTGIKNTTNQNAQDHSTKFQTSKNNTAPKVVRNYRREGLELSSQLKELISKRTATKTVPGIFWGTNVIRVHDAQKILSLVKKIDSKNVMYIRPRLWDYMNDILSREAPDVRGKIIKHYGKVLEDYARNVGLLTPENHIIIYNFKNGKYNAHSQRKLYESFGFPHN